MSALRRTALVMAGLVLLSFNLRPAAVSVGPVLEEVRRGLGLSGAEAGLLTSLPVLAFAIVGALAPSFARIAGLHRALAISLVAVVVGLGGRAAAHDATVFLGLSAFALAGMATANVLIPSLVKLHFPDRIGRATAIYTTALAVGLTSAFLLTVPISDAVGSWRAGLGAWALLAAIALVPWLGLLGHDRHLENGARSISFGDVARTRIGWAMVLFFGLQSLQAYSIFGWFAQLWRDNGYTAEQAGLLLGIVAGVSIPLSLLLPSAAARRADQRGLILAVLACYPVGYAMLLIDRPHPGHPSRPVRRGRVLRLPRRPDADRPTRAHPRRHRRAVRVHPVAGLPDRGDRAVRDRGRLRRHRRLDRPALAAHGAGAAPPGRRGVRRPTGVPRGPAALTRLTSGTMTWCLVVRSPSSSRWASCGGSPTC